MSLCRTDNAELKVNSGTAHVTGRFSYQPVEFTVTPENGLVDLGFVYGAEGVEDPTLKLRSVENINRAKLQFAEM